MKELLTALVAAKSTFTSIKKDKANPFHKSKYATLDSVLGAVEPSLLANDLVLVQAVSEGQLITTLWHTSGQSLASNFKLPELSDPQKLGSQITYYRRYAVCALLSVTADEDDDGSVASKPISQPSVIQSTVATKPPVVPSKPPVAAISLEIEPVVDPKITGCQTAMKECMEILGWDYDRKAKWALTVSKLPYKLWDLNDWERGVSIALSEVDKLNDE